MIGILIFHLTKDSLCSLQICKSQGYCDTLDEYKIRNFFLEFSALKSAFKQLNELRFVNKDNTLKPVARTTVPYINPIVIKSMILTSIQSDSAPFKRE